MRPGRTTSAALRSSWNRSASWERVPAGAEPAIEARARLVQRGLRRHEEERAVDQGERPRDIAREVEEPRAGVERKRARAGVGGELDRALHLGERLAAEPGAVLTARNDEAHAAPGEIHLDAGVVERLPQLQVQRAVPRVARRGGAEKRHAL